MNELHVMGLHGLPGSGKDTFADEFVRVLGEHGVRAVKLHLADPLRDVAEAAFGSRYETQAEKAALDTFWKDRLPHDPHTMDGPKELWLGAEPITGRRILQFIGTDLFRKHVHPDFWCVRLEQRVAALRGVQAIVVPDVRFPNEANLIRRMGNGGYGLGNGRVLHLVNSNLPPVASDHPSDKPLDEAFLDGHVVCSCVDQVLIHARAHAYRVRDAINSKELS
jgi:hypothetical protein